MQTHTDLLQIGCPCVCMCVRVFRSQAWTKALWFRGVGEWGNPDGIRRDDERWRPRVENGCCWIPGWRTLPVTMIKVFPVWKNNNNSTSCSHSVVLKQAPVFQKRRFCETLFKPLISKLEFLFPPHAPMILLATSYLCILQPRCRYDVFSFYLPPQAPRSNSIQNTLRNTYCIGRLTRKEEGNPVIQRQDWVTSTEEHQRGKNPILLSPLRTTGSWERKVRERGKERGDRETVNKEKQKRRVTWQGRWE